MSNIKALRQRAHDITKTMRGLLDAAAAENRELNESEAAKYEENLKALTGSNGISKQVEREEALQEIERNATPGESPNTDAASRAGDPAPKKAGFKSLGEYLLAVVAADRSNGRLVDPRLQAAATGSNEAVPSDGGFLVQSDFSNEILRRVNEGGEVLSRVRRQTVSGNGLVINAVDESSRATGSRWGGVQGYWAQEADTVTSKKPKFRQMELKLSKLMALYYATDELIADASALGGIAEQAFSEELNFLVEDAIIEGTGVGQPLGILNSSALVSVAKEASQVAATIVSENVLKMYARLHPRSRANAGWFVNQDVMPQLPQLNIKIKNVAGSENVGGISTPVYQFPNGDGYGTILGRPVIPVEYCPTLGTKGDVMLLDLSQYLMIEKGGAQAASSMHVRFINDEMTFRITLRVDGQPIWNLPLTPFKGTATQSPFVSLDTRG